MYSMSSFTEEPQLELQPSGLWKVAKGFKYYIGSENSNQWIDIPEGFETDLASVPRFLWGIFSPFDFRWLKAAIIHDFLLSKDGNIRYMKKYGMVVERRFIKRKRKAEIFLEAMQCNEKRPTPHWIAVLFYDIVRGYDIFIFPLVR